MILAKGTSHIGPVSLAAAPERVSYMVEGVTGPEQRRLSEMGFVEGARISVVNRTREGILVVKVGGSRLALARGMADYVMVR
ncbi:MAG: ferrous iron transport protein A [Planctomycetaceae bacterium]|nr:ferrous iron transport protein A [Planctomycetaceae bacterium]